MRTGVSILRTPYGITNESSWSLCIYGVLEIVLGNLSSLWVKGIELARGRESGRGEMKLTCMGE